MLALRQKLANYTVTNVLDIQYDIKECNQSTLARVTTTMTTMTTITTMIAALKIITTRTTTIN